MKKKKLLSLVCALSMMMPTQFMPVSAASYIEPSVIESAVSADGDSVVNEDGKSGTLFNKYDWNFDEATGTLSINYNGTDTNSGMGKSTFDMPWASYAEKISKIKFGTNIDCHTNGLLKGTSIQYFAKSPEGFTIIPMEFFMNCSKLEEVNLSSKISRVGIRGFCNCSSLKSITIADPDCEVEDKGETICNTYDEDTKKAEFSGVIRGYKDSTAQKYAEKYGYNFEAIDDRTVTATSKPASTTTTSASTTKATSATTTSANTTTTSASTTTTIIYSTIPKSTVTSATSAAATNSTTSTSAPSAQTTTAADNEFETLDIKFALPANYKYLPREDGEELIIRTNGTAAVKGPEKLSSSETPDKYNEVKQAISEALIQAVENTKGSCTDTGQLSLSIRRETIRVFNEEGYAEKTGYTISNLQINSCSIVPAVTTTTTTGTTTTTTAPKYTTKTTTTSVNKGVVSRDVSFGTQTPFKYKYNGKDYDIRLFSYAVLNYPENEELNSALQQNIRIYLAELFYDTITKNSDVTPVDELKEKLNEALPDVIKKINDIIKDTNVSVVSVDDIQISSQEVVLMTTTTTYLPTTSTTTTTTTTSAPKPYINILPMKVKLSGSNERTAGVYGFSCSNCTLKEIEYKYIFDDPNVKIIRNEPEYSGSFVSPYVVVEKNDANFSNYTIVITKAIDENGNDLLPYFPKTEIVVKDYIKVTDTGSSTTATTTTVTTTTTTTTTTTPVNGSLADGDVDGNNIIDGRDASAVLTEYAKTSTGAKQSFSDAQMKAADVTKDNIVDGRDASAILTYYAKISAGQDVKLTDFIAE